MKNKNWLSDNIVSIVAITTILFCFTVFLLVLTRQVKTSESTTITILANTSNIVILVLSFYFSSTKSSKDKDAQLNNIIQNPIENKYWLDIIKRATTEAELEALRSKIPTALMVDFENRLKELKNL